MVIAGLAEAHSVAGNNEEADKLLLELDHMASSKYVSPYDVAGVYLRRGDHERALELLGKAFEDHSTWRIFLPVDPKFDPVRDKEFVMQKFEGHRSRGY